MRSWPCMPFFGLSVTNKHCFVVSPEDRVFTDSCRCCCMCLWPAFLVIVISVFPWYFWFTGRRGDLRFRCHAGVEKVVGLCRHRPAPRCRRLGPEFSAQQWTGVLLLERLLLGGVCFVWGLHGGLLHCCAWSRGAAGSISQAVHCGRHAQAGMPGLLASLSLSDAVCKHAVHVLLYQAASALAQLGPGGNRPAAGSA